ncbi:ATP-binding protein [Aneurinibacillus terranovensis]|uniref:ATP-binding protein n=1 Tax=Aneurinibacillus terranovensis TaxID=278991 RepID=UPI00042635D4|nr:ATP-binding protein [Aneurinibacillus terranovensis]
MGEEAVYIRESKERSKQLGIDPTQLPAFGIAMSKEEFEGKRMEYEEILSVVRFFLDKILSSLKGIPILIVITDQKGFVLEMDGDETIRSMVNQLGIKPRFQFTENVCGTNSISLSLQHRHPVQLIGSNHYHHYFHGSACYSVPFHYMEVNNLLGTISIMISIEHATPLLLTMLSTAVDSIERELLLRRQNQRLNLLNQIMLDTTANGVIVTDQRGIITEFNTLAQEITGMKAEDVMGQPVHVIEPMGKYVQHVLQEGKEYQNVELTLQKENERSYVCLFDALQIYDDKAESIGAFCQFRDITEHKKTEELLRKSEKLSIVGQLAAGVAHEIRNPLSTLKGFIQFMQSNNSGNQRYFDIMLSELNRINFIVSEFLILAKPQAMVFKQKNPLHILQDTISLLNSHATMNDIEIFTEFDDHIPEIKCEANQLKQVFINIMKNAMDAMPFGGQIEIKAMNTEDDKIVIRFIDHGCGIPESQMTKLGEAFYSTKDNGTGLGLMVSRKIVENHKGSISIKSQVDQGTTVDIVLPVSFQR